MARWTVAESEELYQIPHWGNGYFKVNDKGNLTMTPPGASAGIDMKVLVDDLQKRGIALPILLRFTDIIQARVETLVNAFTAAGKSTTTKASIAASTRSRSTRTRTWSSRSSPRRGRITSASKPARSPNSRWSWRSWKIPKR